METANDHKKGIISGTIMLEEEVREGREGREGELKAKENHYRGTGKDQRQRPSKVWESKPPETLRMVANFIVVCFVLFSPSFRFSFFPRISLNMKMTYYIMS